MSFFSLVYTYYSSAYFGQGTGPIWLDDLSCSRSELTLLQCSHRRSGSHNCNHSEDESVRCSGSKTGSLFKLKIFSDLSWCLYTGSCTNGDVRLAGGTDSTSGRVEVCAYNQWGIVCRDSWVTGIIMMLI